MNSKDFLEDGARRQLRASDEERIIYIQRDRFITHKTLEWIWAQMLEFVERPKTLRPPCLAIVGDAGAGKTSLLHHFNRAMEERDLTASTRTCVSFSVPASATVGVLLTSLMFALGIPRLLSNTQHRNEADVIISHAMQDTGVRILLIDEIQHLESKTPLHLRNSWDWIKWISTSCGVSVVGAGIRGYERYLYKEPQLQTRFRLVTMPRWQPGPALDEFLTAFERTLPLRKLSKLSTPELQKCIIAETAALENVTGITGGIKRVIEFAAIHAIRSGEERITKAGISAWRSALE